MDEFRQNNRLRGALDAALSGLNGDPALAQRVLRCAEEKPRAAKKLSVGLVFALVALLAATGIAAAAALTGRELLLIVPLAPLLYLPLHWIYRRTRGVYT